MTPREQLQGSFLLFIAFLWLRVLMLPKPTRVQQDIARFLEGGGKRRFIQAFRGVGKTFMTSAYVVWRLWKDPDIKIVIVSASEGFAIEIATFVKSIIDHEVGDDLWPELRSREGQRKSVLAFDVGAAKPDKSPSVKALGINGQLAGSRADIILSDDIETAANSDTEGKREKLKRQIGEYAALLKPGPDSEIIFLGTPQSEQTIYADLPSKGYEVRIWPARYPLEAKLGTYGSFLAPMLLADLERDPSLHKAAGSALGGAPTDPARFHDLDLMERQAEYRDAGFMLQFMLDTALSDAERYPLKLRDLVVMDVDSKTAPARVVWSSSPDLAHKDLENVGFDGDRMYRPMMVSQEWVPFTGRAMHIDPSGRGRDETTYCVTLFLNGFIYVKRWGGFRDGYGEETLKALAEIAKAEEVTFIGIEANFGDGMFGKLLEPVLVRAGYPVHIEDVRAVGQKEVRILDVMAPVMAQHRLILDTTVARGDLKGDTVRSGLYQMTHLTSARGALKHDDRIDVLSMGVKHWVEVMNLDASKAEQELIRKKEQEWERKFFSMHFVGAPPPKPRGIQRGTGRRSVRY